MNNISIPLDVTDMKSREKNPNVYNMTFKTRGSNIVNRSWLSRRQYIKLLAQPRKIAYPSNILKSYKKRTLAKSSARLLLLSLPPKWKILNNWQYYQKILPSYRFERMVDFLSKHNLHMKLVDDSLCKKHVGVKNGKSGRKLSKNICKRNSQIFCVISSLANFLMTPNTGIFTKEQKKIFEYIITFLLERNLWTCECKKLRRDSIEMEFIRAVVKCSLFVSCILCSVNTLDFQLFKEAKTNEHNPKISKSPSSISLTTNDSHQRYNEDKKKMKEEAKFEEKTTHSGKSKQTQTVVSKEYVQTSSNKSKTGNRRSPNNDSRSILKRDIDSDEMARRNIIQTYVQTTTIETFSKFTSTTKTSTCHLLEDCDRNERLLLEIRNFYRRRADLHNKHVFDDVLLPKITLSEIMKYAELVLANQYIAAKKPTTYLQHAFQTKIVQWVQEIISLDGWDDCMKYDVKLLSYELARYITEEQTHILNPTIVETKNLEKFKEIIPDQLKIRTLKVRGTDLNVQHFLDIIPHKSGEVCCASLKVWSAWIKDVAENAKLWCIWINQIIANMTYLSEIMRGEICDKNGNQLSLFACDWKQFICNLDDDIIAWRQYNNHIQSLTDQLTNAFHGKRITCCKCCKNESLHISDSGIKHLYSQLFDAMDTTKSWRQWLQDLVNEAKQLTCISEDRCLCHIPIIEIFPAVPNKCNKEQQNVYNYPDGCPLVPYEQTFVERDPSIYSIENWT